MLARDPPEDRRRKAWLRLAIPLWLGVTASVSVADEDSRGLLDHVAPIRDARDALETRGFTLGASYLLDLVGVVAGGARRGFAAPGYADLSLDVDLGKWLGADGTRVFLLGVGTHGRDPSRFAGDVQVVNNVEAFDTWKLLEGWIEQSLLDGQLAIRLGLFDVSATFDVIPSAAFFVHSSPGTGGDLAAAGRVGPPIYPISSMGAEFEAHLAESYLRFGIYDGVPGDPDQPRGTQVLLDDDDGLFSILEAGLEFDASALFADRVDPTGTSAGDVSAGAPDRPAHPGRIALGAWGFTHELDDFDRPDGQGGFRQRRGDFGVYAFAEQRVFCETLAGDRGLTIFGRGGWADERTSPIDIYAGGGLAYHGLVPRRPHDDLGVGVFAVHFSDGFRDAEAIRAWEIALEATYSIVLSTHAFVQPDFQYIFQPSGARDRHDAILVGLRLVVTF